MAVVANDQFIETTTTQLTSHTADSGESWVGANTTDVIGGTGYLRGDPGAGNQNNRLAYNPANADYEVRARVRWTDDTDGRARVGVVARDDGTIGNFTETGNRYLFWINHDGDWMLRDSTGVVAGSQGVSGDFVSITLNTWYTIKLRVSGTTITCYLDSTVVTSVTNSDLSAAGRGGIYFERIGTAAAIDVDWFEIDDLSVGNQAPVIDNPIPNQSWVRGQFITIDLTNVFSDPDGDELTFFNTQTELPGNLIIDNTADTITGTVLETGDFDNIGIRASDGALQVEDVFNATVRNPRIHMSNVYDKDTGALLERTLSYEFYLAENPIGYEGPSRVTGSAVFEAGEEYISLDLNTAPPGSVGSLILYDPNNVEDRRIYRVVTE